MSRNHILRCTRSKSEQDTETESAWCGASAAGSRRRCAARLQSRTPTATNDKPFSEQQACRKKIAFQGLGMPQRGLTGRPSITTILNLPSYVCVDKTQHLEFERGTHKQARRRSLCCGGCARRNRKPLPSNPQPEKGTEIETTLTKSRQTSRARRHYGRGGRGRGGPN